MLVDLAINPFDADVADMVEAARHAERSGAAAVWVADHFSGAIVGKSWSRDPFVCLGAMAVSTDSIDLGILVANVVNRHPAQLVSAINSVQSLAPGRVRLGLGSGAATGSRFAAEHEAIGRTLGDVDERRRRLIEHIAATRSIYSGEHERIDGVTDGSACPPIIVGASAWPTIAVAVEHADGVNLRRTTSTFEHLERLARVSPDGFEVSVLDWMTDVSADPTTIDRYEAAGADRLILGMSAPFDHRMVAAVLRR